MESHDDGGRAVTLLPLDARPYLLPTMFERRLLSRDSLAGNVDGLTVENINSHTFELKNNNIQVLFAIFVSFSLMLNLSASKVQPR